MHAMSPDDLAHCLRPTFTARIAKHLANGTSVNLIGKPGQGRGRLLSDLAGLPGDEVLWLSVSMKTCRGSFAGLLSQLWERSGLDGIRPGDLGRLTRRLEDSGRRVVFLFHHFDAILDNPDGDSKYDVRFLDHLNALHNRGMALVCVTPKPYSDYVLVSGDKVHRGSTLDLAKEPLPALTVDEIAAELIRAALALDSTERAALAAAMREDGRPLDLLDLARRHLENGEGADKPFAERLKRWRGELRSEARGVAPVRIVAWRQNVVTWWRSAGLDRLLPLGRLGKAAGDLFRSWLKRR
jgi:hypothetical protein